MVVVFAVGILVARYLGPEAYGQLHYALAVIMIMMGVISPGLKDVTTRKFDAESHITGQILKATFRLMLLSNIVMFLLALLVVFLLRPGEDLIWMMAFVIGIGNLFRTFEVFELWFHYKLEMGKTVVIQAFSFLIVSASKLAFIYFGLDVFWFAAITGFELLLTGIGFWLLFAVRGRQRLDMAQKPAKGLKRALFGESLPGIAGLAFTLLLFKVDQVMLGWLLSDTEVGLYAVAVPFSEYWIFLAAALTVSMYPALLESYRDSASKFEDYFQRLCGILIWVSALIIVPVWLFGEFIILFFLGDVYAPSAKILSIHIWSLMFLFLIEPLKKWFVIRQQLRFFLIISGMAAFLNIAMNFWLIPGLGGQGAAWATITAYSCAGFWGLLFFRETRPAMRNIILSVGAPVKMFIKYKNKLK